MLNFAEVKNQHRKSPAVDQGSTNCSILPSQMGERTWSNLGEHGEHGREEKYQPNDIKHSIYDSKVLNQNTLIMTENTYFTASMATVEKT